MDGYKAEFQTLTVPAQIEIERATKIAKIEAFDHWIDKKSETKEQMTAKLLLDGVTAKMAHTFCNLKLALIQVTTERDELQTRLEQLENDRTKSQKWHQLLDEKTIEDSANAITAITRNLAPPISIYQYYRGFKPLILQQSSLPDIRLKSQLTRDQFKAIWT